MKRVILGSLLSCMLVGQAFGAENSPLVNLDAATSLSSGLSNRVMQRSRSEGDLVRLSQQSRDEFRRPLTSPSSPVEATAVSQTVGSDQQIRRDDFKKGFMHGMTANLLGIGLALANNETNMCKAVLSYNAALMYNIVRPVVINDSHGFSSGQLATIPVMLIGIPAAALLWLKCSEVYQSIPCFIKQCLRIPEILKKGYCFGSPGRGNL